MHVIVECFTCFNTDLELKENHLSNGSHLEFMFTLLVDFPAAAAPKAVPASPCCMCNCRGTLQAILREMRAMRRLMQITKGQTLIPHVPAVNNGRRKGRKSNVTVIFWP